MARKSSAVRASFGATISTPASRSSSNSIMTISFEGRLPRDRGAKRKSRLLIETGEPLAGQAFLAHGLEAARRRGLVLGTDFVDSAVDFADRLAHHARAAGALHGVDRVLDAPRDQAPNAQED